MKKWQCGGRWEVGRQAGTLSSLFPSLSDWDPQMFYYAKASYLRVLYCSLSGCPGQGSEGRDAISHANQLLCFFTTPD